MESIKLNKGREQSILRKHPWIFSRAIKQLPKNIEDGDAVLIQDIAGHTLATGHFQDSSLAIRILAFEEISIDTTFWRKRLIDAFRYRQLLQLPDTSTNCFRLIHGEGDQLPGLIVDIYDTVAVLQAHSIGMYRSRMEIAAALQSIPGLTIKSVFCKSKESLPNEYAASVSDEWLAGEDPGEFTIRESGLSFGINVMTGQKTGFFLDQRINRQHVAQYAKDKSVLNCFSYTGGFSMYALHGGATRVISVDSSAVAVALCEKNAELNGKADRHTAVKENVTNYFSSLEEQFDIVIVDPPAFAKSLEKRHNAVQAYKRLNVSAISKVKPGGMLFTFSCSQVVDRLLFHNTIVAAAIEAGRMARVVHDLGQGPDHPASIFHPEGHYLKGLALYVE